MICQELISWKLFLLFEMFIAWPYMPREVKLVSLELFGNEDSEYHVCERNVQKPYFLQPVGWGGWVMLWDTCAHRGSRNSIRFGP
jgi:hypothetical protein